MDHNRLIENLRFISKYENRREYNEINVGEVTATASTAITDLLARAEVAEQKATELDNALSDASKIVKTMQESTIPYYRKRTEAAEKEVEWKNKVIEAAERRFQAAEARAEKAEQDMKRIVNRSSYPCEYCTKEKCFATDMKRRCYDFVWDGGQKEE